MYSLSVGPVVGYKWVSLVIQHVNSGFGWCQITVCWEILTRHFTETTEEINKT